MALCMPQTLRSQNKTLTLDDLIPGGKTYRKYIPSLPQRINWQGDILTYQKGDSIWTVSKETGKDASVLLTLAQVNEVLGDKKISSLQSVQPAKNNAWIIRSQDALTVYNFKENSLLAQFKLSPEMANIDLSQESMTMAYTIKNNLYVQNKNGESFAISDEKNNNIRIIYGQSVHQNEFGIHKGTFWSPTGNLLAFYRMDESMVGVYPLVDTNARIAKEIDRVYPMAGEKSHHVNVGIYNPITHITFYLETGLPKDKYLTNIAWNPEGTVVYIAELNRKQDSLQMNAYDAKTGKKIKTLFTEESDKYVEPQHPIVFLKNNPNKFIWQSQRDGYNHLYLYNTDGKLLKQLTKGAFDVLQFVGMTEDGNTIFYKTNEDNPLDQKVYKQNIKSGKTTLLTKEEGVHQVSLDKTANYMINWFSSQKNPGTVNIIQTQNGKITPFYQAKDPMKGFVMPEIILGSLKANDNKTDLYYRLILPTDFDANKKYPVVIYVYGGPHSQMVTNNWMAGARGWDIYMAERGYIVFTLDNRGTQGRGIEFENATHGQLGVIETEDQMTGVQFLSSLPYVDTNRIGVHGWSFGGFMTLNMMLRHPDVFKVGVAGGPVVDWKYYEVMYGERYMGSPKDNPKGYEESNMTKYIKNLKGRLMVIIGDNDPVVLPQHTSQLMRAAVKEGVHPDLFIYPGHEHNVIGKDRVHLHEHITRYFDDFLKPLKSSVDDDNNEKNQE